MAMFLDSSRFVGTIRFCQVWPVWPSSANLDSAHSQTFRADLTFFVVVVAERECILLCKTFTPKWWRRRPLWVEPRTGYELDWLVLHRVDDDVESGWQNPRECFYFCWSKTRPTTSAGLQFPANRMRGVVSWGGLPHQQRGTDSSTWCRRKVPPPTDVEKMLTSTHLKGPVLVSWSTVIFFRKKQ